MCTDHFDHAHQLERHQRIMTHYKKPETPPPPPPAPKPSTPIATPTPTPTAAKTSEPQVVTGAPSPARPAAATPGLAFQCQYCQMFASDETTLKVHVVRCEEVSVKLAAATPAIAMSSTQEDTSVPGATPPGKAQPPVKDSTTTVRTVSQLSDCTCTHNDLPICSLYRCHTLIANCLFTMP